MPLAFIAHVNVTGSYRIRVSAYFYPRCVVRHSSSFSRSHASDEMVSSGKSAERKEGAERMASARYEHGAWFAGTNRYWLVLQSVREEGEGDHVCLSCMPFTHMSILDVCTYVRSIFRAIRARDSSRARSLEQISGFTNSSALFVSEKSAARLLHIRERRGAPTTFA